MEEEEFSVLMPSMFVPPPSLPQTIKNSFGWSAGKRHHLKAPMSFGEGEGTGTFGSGVASPCIASYSSI